MADANSLDASLLIPWLEAHVEGFSSFKALSKFNTGQSNPTYKIEAASGTYVLRAKPPGRLLKSAHAVDREFKVITALGHTNVPVPKTFALSPEGDASPIGRMFYVMEYLEGRIFWDPALPELGPELGNARHARGRIYDAMNDTLAKLHGVDVAQIGLQDYGKSGNYFARQTDRWAQQYRASEVQHNQMVHDIIDWLEDNMPKDDGQVSIVHGDYRLDNMIFAPDRDVVIGVLDWELSTLGHPLADLAYQCMQWRLPHESGMRGLGGINRQKVGIMSEEEYVAAYCKRRGINTIPHWSFYIAFCFFKLTGILQGVYKRALDGNASNPERAHIMAKAIPILAQAAMDEIKKQK